jgi:hypothetical protein
MPDNVDVSWAPDEQGKQIVSLTFQEKPYYDNSKFKYLFNKYG